MKTSYRVLCRVAMCHTYFTDKLLRGLAARPTADTTERLRRAGLLLRALPTGFEILYADAQATGGPPAGLHVAFPLVFSLHPPDADFAVYTFLAPAPSAPGATETATIRYLAPVPADDKPRLHQGLVMSEADRLPLRPLVFPQAVPVGVSTAILRHYPDGPTVWENKKLPADKPLLINLRAEGSGAYALQLGKEAPDVFFAADFAAAAQPWAMLELGLAVLAAPGATYTLSLAARSTYWQYQLVSNRTLPAGLTIEVGEASPVHFVEAPALPGAATSFLADAAQPLAEHYPGAAYRLVQPAANRAPRVMCAALPYASPKGLRKKNNSADALLITDIFVHL